MQTITEMLSTIGLARTYKALHWAVRDLTATPNGKSLSIQLNAGVFRGTNLVIRDGMERGGDIPAAMVIESLNSWKDIVEKELIKRNVDLDTIVKAHPRQKSEDVY